MTGLQQHRLPAAIWGWLGCALMVLGTFLPAHEASVFSSLQENTLIQSGWGVTIVGAAISMIALIYRLLVKEAINLVGMAVSIAIATGAVIADWQVTLYPYVNGKIDDTGNGTVATASIGLYVVILGVCLVVMSTYIFAKEAWEMRQAEQMPTEVSK